MSDTIRLSGVTVNAPDAIVLARFYAAITGGVAKGTRAGAGRSAAGQPEGVGLGSGSGWSGAVAGPCRTLPSRA